MGLGHPGGGTRRPQMSPVRELGDTGSYWSWGPPCSHHERVQELRRLAWSLNSPPAPPAQGSEAPGHPFPGPGAAMGTATARLGGGFFAPIPSQSIKDEAQDLSPGAAISKPGLIWGAKEQQPLEDPFLISSSANERICE